MTELLASVKRPRVLLATLLITWTLIAGEVGMILSAVTS